MGLWKDVELAVNDGASAAFVEIPNVLSITPPDGDVRVVERAPAFSDTIVPKEPGIQNGGTLEWEMEYDEAELARLKALKGVTTSQWKITLPAGLGSATHTYTGFLTKAVKANMTGPEGEAKIACSVEVTSDDTVA